ncbi:hypothetical protein Tco_1041675 [Tanacetum coccineum]|uniref:Copia protein n=1 Tax=Tanacetum coccineum TaxID=301880 RepID=A0ABQ5GHF8_9ASTR
MIGSLLYLTASRPDNQFSVGLCARFQEAPKTSSPLKVKRVTRYIKGTTHLGLWYPKGTDIETVVYADSDHAGDYVDRKSTSGICTFVGCCLTSWFSKKQTALAISTTEVEYVSAEKACQQALWMKQALIDYDKGHISIEKVSSVDTIADILTKPLNDHGKKRPRDSNAGSSSTTLNHPSSFHLLDDIVDVNDKESFRSNFSSPSQNVSSSSNVVSRVLKNPPHESQHLNTYLSKTINHQTQHRDDHWKRLRSIGKALKDMMSAKRK